MIATTAIATSLTSLSLFDYLCDTLGNIAIAAPSGALRYAAAPLTTARKGIRGERDPSEALKHSQPHRALKYEYLTQGKNE